MKSTIGRPRALTDVQVAIILAWHERYVAWKALRAALRASSRESWVSRRQRSPTSSRVAGNSNSPRRSSARVRYRGAGGGWLSCERAASGDRSCALRPAICSHITLIAPT